MMEYLNGQHNAHRRAFRNGEETMTTKPCWLCEGRGTFAQPGEHRVNVCGLCNGEGEYEPIPRPRPYIMAVAGKVHVRGDFTLAKDDALWALMWAEAIER